MTVARRGTGILFVISAPSGTGKSTAARRLVREVEDLEFSVSFTTRAPRPGERDSREYHFVDRQRFRSMIDAKEFLEWADVFGQYYGTGLELTRGALAEGRDLLLDIDVQGAAQVRGGPVAAVSVMILPPDYATLETRLRGRGSEGEREREQRLARARREAAEYEHFDYVVTNDRLERTTAEIASIVRAERRRTSRCSNEAEAILATFPPQSAGKG